ncbi:small RNA 2'-O-methyltransferase-like isoform X2 [Artemia franciscana]|uniref:small RNA 2'-O-methyltransferase-like isoform X2 n=1 Tax=Artemia franciscana TaxID=6661 RepID=UPI0032D9E217
MGEESQFSDVEEDRQLVEEEKRNIVEHSSLNPVAPSFYPSPVKKKFRNYTQISEGRGIGCWQTVYQFSDVDVIPHDYGGDRLKDDNETIILFDPPVYIQRYSAVVSEIFDYPNYRRMVDFGSSTCAVFRYLKTLSFLEEIVLVDVDESTLRNNCDVAKPTICDSLERRTQPLEVFIMSGDMSEFEDRLQGCDIVTGIEVIEHLYPDTLEKVPEMIFRRIQPKLVLLTTPNKEFNVLFRNSKEMRHWDHKFEWTRDEFKNWCEKICSSYPDYSFEIKGIGQGFAGSEHLGCCSQMAVFKRISPNDEFQSVIHEEMSRTPYNKWNKYKVVAHYSYPVYRETRTQDQIMLDNARFKISSLVWENRMDRSLTIFVQVSEILNYLLEIDKTADKERIFLTDLSIHNDNFQTQSCTSSGCS